MQRKKTFLVVCFSILMTGLFAQTPHPAPVDKFLPDHLEFKRIFTTPVRDTLPPFRITAVNSLSPIRITTASTLGFFCKEELVIQKTLRLPIYFRLGSLEYARRLEGK